MGTYAVQLCGEVLDAAEYPPPVDKSTFAAAMPGFLQRMQAHAPACWLPAQEFSQLSPVLRVPAVGSNPSWAKLVRSLPGVDVALAAFSVKNYPPLAARYYMWAASTDMISPLRSWPISCPEESPMCRVASGSSRARPRA
jgi:hypothetical protein